MIELKKETERVILVGVCLPGQEDIDASLEELSELAKTAGAVTVGKVVQSRIRYTRELMSERERLMRSKAFCGSWMQQELSVMMNCRRHR